MNTSLLQAILDCMIDTGRACPTDRIALVDVTGEPSSDYRRVEVTLTKARCKKPYVAWNLSLNIARNTINWETSTFYYL